MATQKHLEDTVYTYKGFKSFLFHKFLPKTTLCTNSSLSLFMMSLTSCCCLQTATCGIRQSTSVVSYSVGLSHFSQAHWLSLCLYIWCWTVELRQQHRDSSSSDLLSNKHCSSELLGTQPSLVFRASLMGLDRLSPPLWIGASLLPDMLELY